MLETVEVTEGGVTVHVPVPHQFIFTMKDEVPVMHYKILASDPDELTFPAKRDPHGKIIFKHREDGSKYWETDPAGIPIGVGCPELCWVVMGVCGCSQGLGWL